MSISAETSRPQAVKPRMARQATEMVLWRFVAMAVGVAGSIWAARCLGPKNLGISGMIATTLAQLALLIDLNLNAVVIRHFKECADQKDRSTLVGTIFTFRMVIALLLMASGLVVLLFTSVPPSWKLGICAAFPLLLFSCNQPVWLFQAEEKLPTNYKILTLQALLTSSIYFIIFRRGMSAGADVVVQATATSVAFVLGWYFAVRGKDYRLFQLSLLPRAWPIIKEGFWLTLTGIVIYIYTSLELPLIGYLHSLPELGRYRTAANLTGIFQQFYSVLPLLLYPRFIEWSKTDPALLWSRQKQIAGWGGLASIPIVGIAFLAAPGFYKLVYGAEFVPAAYPFAILLASKCVVFVGAIYAWGLWAQKKDKGMLAIMSLTAVFCIVSNFLLIPHYGMYAAATINLMSEVLILAGAFFLSHRSQTARFAPAVIANVPA